MKFNKIASAVVLSMGMVAFGANAADQGSGSVTFTGSIIDAPCSIHPDSVDQVVELGQVASAALKNSGKSTPRFFDIKLENCSLDTSKDENGKPVAANTVSITFGGPEANDAKDLVAISGDAKGAGVAIEDMMGKRVILGKATEAQSLIAGDNTLQLSSYLVGLGNDDAIEAGEFQAVSNFTMSYE